MARRKGMIGPGSKAMGGAGIGAAAGKPRTAMTGRSPMAAPGGLPGLLGGAGAGPSRPPRPPMGGGGMGGGPPMPGGAPVAKSPAGGMGGAAGFRQGGEVKEEKKEHEEYAFGGAVKPSGEKEEKSEQKMGLAKGGGVHKFARGGSVGGDAKGRVARDTGKAGKSC